MRIVTIRSLTPENHLATILQPVSTILVTLFVCCCFTPFFVTNLCWWSHVVASSRGTGVQCMASLVFVKLYLGALKLHTPMKPLNFFEPMPHQIGRLWLFCYILQGNFAPNREMGFILLYFTGESHVKSENRGYIAVFYSNISHQIGRLWLFC